VAAGFVAALELERSEGHGVQTRGGRNGGFSVTFNSGATKWIAAKPQFHDDAGRSWRDRISVDRELAAVQRPLYASNRRQRAWGRDRSALSKPSP